MITVIVAATVRVAVTLDQAKTIQIKSDTKRRLDELGKKGETYDAIIRKLINLYQKCSESPDTKMLLEWCSMT